MILVILTIIYTIIKCVTDKYIIIMKKASSSILLIVTFCCIVSLRAQAPMRTLPGNYLATPLTRISIEDLKNIVVRRIGVHTETGTIFVDGIP